LLADSVVQIIDSSLLHVIWPCLLTVAESGSAEIDDQPTCTACYVTDTARDARAVFWGAIGSWCQVISQLTY